MGIVVCEGLRRGSGLCMIFLAVPFGDGREVTLFSFLVRDPHWVEREQ